MCVCVIAWVGGGGVGVQGDMIDWKAVIAISNSMVNIVANICHLLIN